MKFNSKRGIGYCGLACVLCSDEDCPGCAAGMKDGGGCSAGKCAAEKSIGGCHACSDYASCAENMPHGKRNRAFNRYAREFGIDALIERLRINYENGVTYHRPDKSAGDYDVLETEDEIYKLLRFGTGDPYKKCPVFETEHFILRLIAEEDAEDLRVCCSDPKAQRIMNSDNCSFGYDNVSTLEMMCHNNNLWIQAYKDRQFIRFTIVDRKTQKAVGTVEMFNYGNITTYIGGILRIDIASPYETRDYIPELLSIANENFFALFDVECIVTKAIPEANERISALLSTGYAPLIWESGREFYYSKVDEQIK